MTQFVKKCERGVAMKRLSDAGWIPRSQQTGGDFEDYVRSSGAGGLLLVDFALGRFILDKAGDSWLLNTKRLLTESDDMEGDGEYDAILHALFEGEVVA